MNERNRLKQTMYMERYGCVTGRIKSPAPIIQYLKGRAGQAARNRAIISADFADIEKRVAMWQGVYSAPA